MKSIVVPPFYKYLFIFLTINSFGFSQTTSVENSVNITIDKNTTDEDLEGIKSMLAEHNVTSNFNDINRNSKNEITSISIELKSEHSAASSSYNFSGTAIKPISFGIKNDNLYIGQSDFDFGMSSLKNRLSQFNFFSDNDSIFEKGFSGFRNFFGNTKDPFFIGRDSTSIESIKEMLRNKLHLKESDVDAFNSMFDDQKEQNNQRYSFIDDPDKDKLIVIDGEISDFNKLDELAKSNKIETVDILKPKTAMSIYGKKAKDGAIIVITE